MALSGADLKAAIDAVSFDMPDINPGESAAAYRTRVEGLVDGNRLKACNAIIDYITGNAVVTGTCPAMGGPLVGGSVT